MLFELDAVEARVLGCLLEKEMGTPEYYPLSLNALVNACNQKSNRDPHMRLTEGDVAAAFDRLRHRGLAMLITGGEHRVPKHAHRVGESLNLSNRELAVLCVLLLRGRQTPGELRTRTQNLHPFDDLEAVESALHKLAAREPDPLAVQLPRQPGSREQRWAHLLSGPVEADEVPVAEPAPREGLAARVEALEQEVAAMKAELAALKAQLGG